MSFSDVKINLSFDVNGNYISKFVFGMRQEFWTIQWESVMVGAARTFRCSAVAEDLRFSDHR